MNLKKLSTEVQVKEFNIKIIRYPSYE